MKVGDLVRAMYGTENAWMGIIVRASNGYIMVYSLTNEHAGWYHPTNFEVMNEDR